MFNVDRTPNAPPSLANHTSYSDEDVLYELREIFYNKCYLCESKEPADINVEHLVPHRNNPELKFAWTNLFYCCSRCNNIKRDKYLNIVDCCDQTKDVASLIRTIPPRTPYQSHIEVSTNSPDPQIQETVLLLHEIYNSQKTINKSITGAHLRKRIFARYNRFIGLVTEYLDEELSQERREEALERLKGTVSKTQEFSAFIRWLVIEDEILNELLMEHVGQ